MKARSAMQKVEDQRFWHSVIRAIPGTFLVGVATLICYASRLDLTVTGFIYLIIVVLQSLIGDFVSSAIVSVIADLCLNFFFAPPLFSFRVSDSSDFWALIAFLLTRFSWVECWPIVNTRAAACNSCPPEQRQSRPASVRLRSSGMSGTHQPAFRSGLDSWSHALGARLV